MKKTRIRTFDILRGIAIALMVLDHTHNYWIADNSRWMVAVLNYILNPMGVPTFTFVSGLSFGFSWQNKLDKKYSEKDIKILTVPRTLIMLFISLAYNSFLYFIEEFSVESFKYIFVCQILLTLVICRIMMCELMRFNKLTRVMIAAIILVFTAFFKPYLFSLKDSSVGYGILYFIFFISDNNFLYFFPFFVIGTIMGEHVLKLSSLKNLKNSSKDSGAQILNILKKWASYGILLLFVGYLIGLRKVSSNFDPIWTLIEELNTHPDITNLNEIFLFLVRSSYAWNICSMGWNLIYLAIIFYIVDYKKKLKFNRTPLIILGRYSLSTYIIHLIPLKLINLNLNHIGIIIGFSIYILILYILFYILDRRVQGLVSVEYCVGKLSRSIENEWKRRFHIKRKI